MFGGTGLNLGKENFADLWVFEFRTMKFREILCSKANRPPGMYGHTLSYLDNGLYLIGGTNGTKYFNDVYRFDILSN